MYAKPGQIWQDKRTGEKYVLVIQGEPGVKNHLLVAIGKKGRMLVANQENMMGVSDNDLHRFMKHVGFYPDYEKDFHTRGRLKDNKPKKLPKPKPEHKSEPKRQGPFANAEVISTYSEEEAVNDDMLFDISIVNPRWQTEGPFRYVTKNLMLKGYMDQKGRVNMPNLIDLLRQCGKALQKHHQENPNDWFCSTEVELPSGKKQKVFMVLNHKGRFTIMLPEDY